MWLYHKVMSPKDADGMANSVDPDQTAPQGAVWSGSALFAQALSVQKFTIITVLVEIGINTHKITKVCIIF